ncbi:MAG: hypothetical protein KAS71_16575 [Bacteroidales bacterium]|nr:hypothetical protein [Bacteroidales bacterium]
MLIFLFSAVFIPKEKLIEEISTIPTDPVAVYLELTSMDHEMNEKVNVESPNWMNLFNTSQHNISICKIDALPFEKIIYHMRINEECNIEYGFLFDSSTEGTNVTSFVFFKSLKYPFQRLKSLFMPLYIKPGLQKELDNLNMILVE